MLQGGTCKLNELGAHCNDVVLVSQSQGNSALPPAKAQMHELWRLLKQTQACHCCASQQPAKSFHSYEGLPVKRRGSQGFVAA